FARYDDVNRFIRSLNPFFTLQVSRTITLAVAAGNVRETAAAAIRRAHVTPTRDEGHDGVEPGLPRTVPCLARRCPPRRLGPRSRRRTGGRSIERPADRPRLRPDPPRARRG